MTSDVCFRIFKEILSSLSDIQKKNFLNKIQKCIGVKPQKKKKYESKEDLKNKYLEMLE